MPSRYVLHARSFVGPLKAPTRNELRMAESNDRCELEAVADRLREAGFRVWLYERTDRGHGQSQLTTFCELHPEQLNGP